MPRTTDRRALAALIERSPRVDKKFQRHLRIGFQRKVKEDGIEFAQARGVGIPGNADDFDRWFLFVIGECFAKGILAGPKFSRGGFHDDGDPRVSIDFRLGKVAAVDDGNPEHGKEFRRD